MKTQDLRIRSSEGPEFDCLLMRPAGGEARPAVVLASAIHGVDDDLRRIAADFASRGYLAAAPDLFWRSVPGPLARDDPRSAPRGQPRLPKIKEGERDLADVLAMLRRQPAFNGRAAVMGFCYGGPYAIVGPRRLGYDAGISCHGSQMLDFTGDLAGAGRPVCVIWGDQDTFAPAPVLDAYRALSSQAKGVEVHVLPGVQHGYMMRGNAKAYDKAAYDFSMSRALAILESLRGDSLAAGSSAGERP
ncbi:MAG TPA: dienelactone hydrolase family protein [Usitatibacter sp.]|nr:dienelactone hydrolase family protein [Usitatibacter sp.]